MTGEGFSLMEVAAAMDAATFIVGVHGGCTLHPHTPNTTI